MAYYIKEQTANGVTTEFSLNDLTDNDIYFSELDLLNDIKEFNTGYEAHGHSRYSNANLEVVIHGILSKEEIQDNLLEIGETGAYRLNSKNELYTQKEENADWLFCGQVRSHSQVHDIFDTIKES